MRRLAVQFVLGAALAAVALGWLWRHIASSSDLTPAQLLALVADVPLWAWAAYAAMFGAVHALRTWRWVLQLRPLGERDWRLTTRVCLVGYAAIVVFPFRLGELVRPFLLAARSPRVPFAAALGTAVVERVVDGLVITGLLWLAVATAPFPGAAVVRAAGQASALVFLAASFGLGLFVWRRDTAVWLLGASTAPVSWLAKRALGRDIGLAAKLESLLHEFVGGVSSLVRDGGFATFLALTVAYWGVNALGMWVLAGAFGIQFPVLASVGVLAVLVVGLMVPSASGFIGTFQIFLVEGMRLYVADSPATGASMLAMAVAMNAVQLVIQIGAAFPAMRGLNMTWGDMMRAQRDAQDAR